MNRAKHCRPYKAGFQITNYSLDAPHGHFFDKEKLQKWGEGYRRGSVGVGDL